LKKNLKFKNFEPIAATIFFIKAYFASFGLFDCEFGDSTHVVMGGRPQNCLDNTVIVFLKAL
jgi:hypothetical protein